MNIISVIKTEKVQDIPAALRALANIVENDIRINGWRANSMGIFGEKDTVSGDFDYQIHPTNITSIAQLFKNF